MSEQNIRLFREKKKQHKVNN